MQDRPVCFQCNKEINNNSDMVFESPCGHDTCSSAVFHGICLFDWRERREQWIETMKRFMSEHGVEMKEEEEG